MASGEKDATVVFKNLDPHTMIIGPAGDVAKAYGHKADSPVRRYFLDMYVRPIIGADPVAAATALGHSVLSAEVCGNVFRGQQAVERIPELADARSRSAAGEVVFFNMFRMFVGRLLGRWDLVATAVSLPGETFEQFQFRSAGVDLVGAVVGATEPTYLRLDLFRADPVPINPGQTGGGIVAYCCGGGLPGDGAVVAGAMDCFLAPRPPPDLVYALSMARFVKVYYGSDEARMSTHVYCQPGMPLCLHMPQRSLRVSDITDELRCAPAGRRYVPKGAGPYLSYLMAVIRENASAIASCDDPGKLRVYAIRDMYGVISGLPVRTKAHVDAVEGVIRMSAGALRGLVRAFSRAGTLAASLAEYATGTPGDEAGRHNLHMLLWYAVVHVFEALTLGLKFLPGLTAAELRALATVTDPLDLMAACILSFLRTRKDLL